VLGVARSKTGKHGSAKAHVTAIDPITGRKVEHILPASQLDASVSSAVRCNSPAREAGRDGVGA
jgi:translation elongation factor P/translation initiation factor 5A